MWRVLQRYLEDVNSLAFYWAGPGHYIVFPLNMKFELRFYRYMIPRITKSWNQQHLIISFVIFMFLCFCRCEAVSELNKDSLLPPQFLQTKKNQSSFCSRYLQGSASTSISNELETQNWKRRWVSFLFWMWKCRSSSSTFRIARLLH